MLIRTVGNSAHDVSYHIYIFFIYICVLGALLRASFVYVGSVSVSETLCKDTKTFSNAVYGNISFDFVTFFT